jgi:hypothetical protein
MQLDINTNTNATSATLTVLTDSQVRSPLRRPVRALPRRLDAETPNRNPVLSAPPEATILHCNELTGCQQTLPDSSAVVTESSVSPTASEEKWDEAAEWAAFNLDLEMAMADVALFDTDAMERDRDLSLTAESSPSKNQGPDDMESLFDADSESEDFFKEAADHDLVFFDTTAMIRDGLLPLSTQNTGQIEFYRSNQSNSSSLLHNLASSVASTQSLEIECASILQSFSQYKNSTAASGSISSLSDTFGEFDFILKPCSI